jgi:formylmethanofuran dehydrogenase subunit E
MDELVKLRPHNETCECMMTYRTFVVAEDRQEIENMSCDEYLTDMIVLFIDDVIVVTRPTQMEYINEHKHYSYIVCDGCDGGIYNIDDLYVHTDVELCARCSDYLYELVS